MTVYNPPITFPNKAPQELTLQDLQTFYNSLPIDAPEGLTGQDGKPVITARSVMPRDAAKHIFQLPLEGNRNIWLDLAKTYCACLEKTRSAYQVQSLVKAALKLGLRVHSDYIVNGEVGEVNAQIEAEYQESGKPRPSADNNTTMVRRRLDTVPAPKRAPVVNLMGKNPLPTDINTPDGISEKAVNDNLVWIETQLVAVHSWRETVDKQAGELAAYYEGLKSELSSKKSELVRAFELKEASALRQRLDALAAKYPELAAKPEPAKIVKGKTVRDLKQLKAATQGK